MKKIAVLLTVYNRKDITLRGLHSLYRAIAVVGEKYAFDVYMVDDACTDGTEKAVLKDFPHVNIIKGNGNLFWGGGMRKAWQTAIDSGNKYDFFLWFNDDVELFDDALLSLFYAHNSCGDNCLITGAFCDCEGKPSYGGKNVEFHPLAPDGSFQDVKLMNGNLVLIPMNVFSSIGMIDKAFKHSLGDYDYGQRARKCNFDIKLTSKYVGVCNRHDEIIPRFYSRELSLYERVRLSYSPMYSVYSNFVYIIRYEGFVKAVKYFFARHYYALFPKYINRNIE